MSDRRDLRKSTSALRQLVNIITDGQIFGNLTKKRVKAAPFCFGISVYCSVKKNRVCMKSCLHLTVTTQWSDEPRGEVTLWEKHSGTVVRNKSRRYPVSPSRSGTLVGEVTIWLRLKEMAKSWVVWPWESVQREWVSHSLLWILKSPKTATWAPGHFLRMKLICFEISFNTSQSSERDLYKKRREVFLSGSKRQDIRAFDSRSLKAFSRESGSSLQKTPTYGKERYLTCAMFIHLE